MIATDPSHSIATNPFVYNSSDFRALNIQIIRWWQLLPSIIIFAALAWFFGSVMFDDGFNWFMAGLLFLILVAMLGPWTWRPLLLRWWLRRQGLLEPMTVAIEPDCFVVHTSQADARIKWSGIRMIKRKAPRLFLFSSARTAHIIPRRAFDNDRHFESFAEAAQERWDQNH